MSSIVCLRVLYAQKRLGLFVVELVEIAVKSGKRVEPTLKSKISNARIFFLFVASRKVLKPNHIYIVVNIIAYIAVKNLGKVIFAVSKSGGKSI